MLSYNIRVSLDSGVHLSRLVSTGRLTEATERPKGTVGPAYGMRGLPQVLDHSSLRVADCVIQAQLYTLPPEEYAGMLQMSPEFAQYSMASLLPALQRPLDAEQQLDWLQRLATYVLAGSQVDSAPHLLLGHPVLPAEWSPERTVFSHGDSGWLLTLYFKTPTVLSTEGLSRSAAGIDVGLASLAVTAFQSGLVHRASGIQNICLTPQLLERVLPGNLPAQHQVEREVSILRHAAARHQLQFVVQTLLSAASVVYVENLTYDDMTQQFKRLSRELGLRDFLLSWLPQRLSAAGIPWQRVAPDKTSQLCAVTHLRGSRDPRDSTRFTNAEGQVVDADVNAARIIMQMGLAYRLVGSSTLQRRT